MSTYWHPEPTINYFLITKGMGKRGYLSLEDSQDSEELARIARDISPSIQVILPALSAKKVHIETATLIVLHGDALEARAFLLNDIISQGIPILYLGVEEQLDLFLAELESANLIDCLTLPISVELLQHKLRFLTKVHKLSSERQDQTTTLHQQLKVFYNRDGLTGLFNRRRLTDRLQLFLEKAIQEEGELSLLILNIDYFNNVNKSYGLDFGDFLLNAMAARLTDTTPENASCYRFSGEDFVVLLPDTDLESAVTVAKKINDACSGKPFWDGEQSVSITLSTGIASVQTHQPKNHTEFLCMAETALFGAKASGRNRARIYSPHGDQHTLSSQQTLALLKENLTKILEKTRNSAIASLQLLTSSVAEPGHQEHIAMVSEYLDLFSTQLGLPDNYTQTFKNSIALYSSFRCLLHKDIYSKPSTLSKEDRMTIQDLPFKLNELVDMFDYFAKERNVLLSHCERYDGTGYPLGLAREEIPLGARVFHIIDALAAMNGDRPYRKRLTSHQIINELFDGAGKQFDPRLVDQIFTLIKNHQIIDIDPLEIQAKQKQLLDRFPEL